MSYKARFLEMASRARLGQRALEAAGADARSQVLKEAARLIVSSKERILEINAEEVEAARRNGAPPAFLDRLELGPDGPVAIARGVEAIAAQPDPAGREQRRWTRENGLVISQVGAPIGVIGVVFESRPNVAADAAALCLRSANGAILRSGSEAAGTSAALAGAFRTALCRAGLPEDAIMTPPDAERAWVTAMLEADEGGCDLVIPRGGKSLVAHVRKHARIPVLSHLDGVCHVYVHASADPEMAVRVTLDSKMRRTGVCNAAETLLVDRACAPDLLPRIAGRLRREGCQLRGDAEACAMAPPMEAASPDDWTEEYLDAVLAVRVVEDIDAALEHIARFGSAHTETIIAEDAMAASRFLAEAGSAVVLHNASTGFADGGEFGFGGEIGIATGRMHARGPVGAEQLTTGRYIVRGKGQVRGSWPH